MNRNELLTGDQNILSRTKYFCPGQNFFCPRQNFFVPDKTFFVHAEGRGIKQLFAGLNTNHQPLSAFFGLHWPQRSFCLKGQIQIGYFVPQYVCSSALPPLRQLFAGLKTEYLPFSAFKGHEGQIRIAYCVLR